MSGEELIQRGYVDEGKIKGDRFGKYEVMELGSTTLNELLKSGIIKKVKNDIKYPFTLYSPPKNAALCKPDSIYLSRESGEIKLIANKEIKKPSELNTSAKKQKAVEQVLFAGHAISSQISIITDGKQYLYVDVKKSIEHQKVIYIDEPRQFNPAVLESLLEGSVGLVKNPGELAEKVWQAIWHATKEEPKQCLMTFVEIFILKFLSDNLAESALPKRFSFYELVKYSEDDFKATYGKTQIEYYVQEVRSHIKSVFKEKVVVNSSLANELFGIKTLVSNTSLINGFAFLKSGSTSIETFNRTFLEILGYFNKFGGLQNIEPEFKLRLYEIFLKKSVRQQKLGQFFTPRNIVKAMIKMARLNKLKDNSIVFDPAAGVGGFLLETLIESDALQGNIVFKGGLPKSRVKLIGSDCDQNTNILAKANMLIHLSECLRDPNVSIEGLNQLMAETFLLLNTNQHLGTLEYPLTNKVDVVLTNPPYVTQGSRIYKQEISALKGLRNNIDLRDYYDRVGLGLESLFLRYVAGALKPGGVAYVIVPQGLLTRTEGTTKNKILSECNVIASISLPRNTFYSTPQKTYILILEKRRTPVDERPNVFCAIATSVGESLDARRVSTPTDNDLDLIADAYLLHRDGSSAFGKISHAVKVVPSNSFGENDRWDIYRFWSDEELVTLGEREEAISRVSFMDEIVQRMKELTEEIEVVENELVSLKKCPMKILSVSDESYFLVRRGKRVTRKDGDQNPGDIPVYSGSKDPLRPICRVSRKFAKANNIPIESKPIITVNANGYVGAVFLRDEACIIHDDVMILDVISSQLDKDYVVYALRGAIAEGNYEYEAKLYNRVKEIALEIPVNEKGEPDYKMQKQISSVYKKFEVLKQSISELGNWANDARIKE